MAQAVQPAQGGTRPAAQGCLLALAAVGASRSLEHSLCMPSLRGYFSPIGVHMLSSA